MQHFILTKLATGAPSERWLRQRIGLFEQFTAPSVNAQTCRDFAWILAVGPATPAWFMARARRAAPHAVLVVYPEDRIWIDWKRVLAPLQADGPLLTTRLDSDDALNRHFVADLQGRAGAVRSTCVIDFPSGYKLRCEPMSLRSMHYVKPSPFLSLLDLTQDWTAYRGPHGRIGEIYPVQTIDARHSWIQVCHASNLLNSFPANAAAPAGCADDWEAMRREFGIGGRP